MSQNRGIALPLAIFALAVAGALAGTAFWIAIIDRRAGRNSLALQEALGAAELAAVRGLSGARRPAALVAQAELSDTVRGLDERVLGVGTVRRLSESLFLVTGTGTSRGGVGRQRVSILARLSAPGLAIDQPLMAAGPVTRVGGREVLSSDATDPACGPAEFSSRVSQSAHETGYEDLQTWAALASKKLARGTYVTIGPVSGPEGCLTSVGSNWGDPLDDKGHCSHYRPIILVDGDLELAGGIGQGVLVVSGDLTLRSGFAYHGLILVGGVLSVEGAGAGVIGAVQVGSPERGSVSLEGDLRVEYAPCVLMEAGMEAGRLVPITGRRWVAAH